MTSRKSISILITDVDNTLYDYVEMFGPSFRSMVHVLSNDLSIDEQLLYSEFREIFQEVGTFDYKHLISKLSFVKKLSAIELNRQIIRGRQAYDRTKAQRLKPYPNVIETLQRLSLGGVKIIAATNAPYHHVSRRLRDIGVLPFFSGLIAWEGNYLEGTPSEFKETLENTRARLTSKLEVFEVFARGEMKPSPVPFERVFDYFGQGAQYFALGDSPKKDLEPAARLGMKTIWARYGTKVDPANLETLLKLTPWSSEDVELHDDVSSFSPQLIIDDLCELLTIIPHTAQYTKQPGLFDDE